MKITSNKFVAAEYELYVTAEENGELELMESTTDQEPLKFIYGVGMMLPKFEEQLFGLQAGDSFEFEVKNEDAYGPYSEEHLIELDRAVFEVDGKIDETMIFEGNVVPLMDSEGNKLNAQVVSVGDKVKVDLNHPLAGEDLHFKGKVLEVRDATDEELAALSGGGCGSGCGDDHGADAGGCGGCGCGC